VEISIDFEHQLLDGHDKQGEIQMSLIACGKIHQGHEWFIL